MKEKTKREEKSDDCFAEAVASSFLPAVKVPPKKNGAQKKK